MAMAGGIPGVLLLLRPVIYLIFSRKRVLDEYAAIDTTAVVLIAYSFAALWFGWKAISQSGTQLGRNVLFRSPITWFLVYTLYGAVSMVWSVNPILTGYRAFECLAMTVLLVAVIQELTENGGIELVLTWSLLYCAWDIVLSFTQRAMIAPDWWYLSECSQMMAPIFFFISLLYTPRKWYNWLIMFFSLVSGSTVSYIGMAIGAVGTFWGNRKIRIYAWLGVTVLILATLYVGPYRMLKDTVFHDKKEISITETSGRDKIMEITLNALDENPNGLGFFAAEPHILYHTFRGAIGAHNAIFSAAMGLGYAGVALISIFFISVALSVFSKSSKGELKSMMIGCFWVALIQSIGNPGVGSRVYGAWTASMYIFILISTIHIMSKEDYKSIDE